MPKIKDLKINVSVDEESLNELKKKMNRLNEIIIEANSIIDSLDKIKITTRFKDLDS